MKIGIVGSIHDLGWKVLQSQGHTIIDVKDTSVDSLKNELAEVSGIVLRTAKMPNEVIDACPHLQIIGRHGVGYDNVDLNYLNEKKNSSRCHWYSQCCQRSRACDDIFLTAYQKYSPL